MRAYIHAFQHRPWNEECLTAYNGFRKLGIECVLFSNNEELNKRRREDVVVSSDYHIATGELLFKAESILRANAPGNEKLEVISNAAWKAPSGSLSAMFQAGALIELFGDVETAFDIYYDNYDIHGLPPLH